MTHFATFILLLSVFLFTGCSSQQDIMSGEELDFGNWYPWDFCPTGTFANAFEVEAKVEEPGTLIQDGRGMTGMRLFCAADANHNETILSSHYSIGAGTWRGKKICPPGDHLVGFRFRLEPKQGWNHDDTAGNDVDMMCSSGIELNGGGNIRGTWNSWANCTQGTAVCGLQTKMEEEKFFNVDKVSLVSVRLHCCSLSGTPIQPLSGTQNQQPKQIHFPALHENDTHSISGQLSKGAVEPLPVKSEAPMPEQGTGYIPSGLKNDATAPKLNESPKHEDATQVNHDAPNLHNETSSGVMSHLAGSTNHTDDHMNHPDDHMNHPVDNMNHPVDNMNHIDDHTNHPDSHVKDPMTQNPKIDENKVN